MWALVGRKLELLCIPCVERILGRKITAEDLSDCPGNAGTFLLIERLRAEVRT